MQSLGYKLFELEVIQKSRLCVFWGGYTSLNIWDDKKMNDDSVFGWDRVVNK